MKEIKVVVPDGKSVEWQELDGKLVLCCVDCLSTSASNEKKASKKVYRSITERIKTFVDAKEELGDNHPLVKEYLAIWNLKILLHSDLMAYLRLRIIVAALNEGWEAKFTPGETRWYPYFILYTKEQTERMNDADKSELLRVCGHEYKGAGYGIASSSSESGFSSSGPDFGANLALKTSQLAEYCGKQFVDIWIPFVFHI